jgi:hypothetical protein
MIGQDQTTVKNWKISLTINWQLAISIQIIKWTNLWCKLMRGTSWLNSLFKIQLKLKMKDKMRSNHWSQDQLSTVIWIYFTSLRKVSMMSRILWLWVSMRRINSKRITKGPFTMRSQRTTVSSNPFSSFLSK